LSTSSLIRRGGLSAIAAGVLLAADALVANLGSGGLTVSALHHLSIVAPKLGWLLLLGGLAGLHARQAGLYGRLGATGFWVAFAGILFGTVLGTLPWLARALAGDLVPTAWALLGSIVAGSSYLVAVGVGLLLLGVATLRARVLSMPWRLLPLAMFVVKVPLPPLAGLAMGSELKRDLIVGGDARSELLAFLVWDTPDLLFGLGWVLLGYALWSGASEEAKSPAPDG
jgi:hypothetical protein